MTLRNYYLTLATGIGDTKLFTGTQKLLDDLTTGLLVLSIPTAIVLVIYFLIMRAAADENDQKKWQNRLVVTLVSVIGTVVASVVIKAVLAYYQ